MWWICRRWLVCTLVALMAGCIQYSERIHFNPDGSGWVSAHLSVPRQTDSAGVPLPEFSRDELARMLRKEGVTIRRIEREENDSAVVWHVEYAFRDLEAFRRTRNGGRDVSLVQYDADTYELELVFSSRENPPSRRTTGERRRRRRPEGVAVIDTQAFAPLLRTFSVTFVIEMPTRVLSAPRGRISDNTATFTWSYRKDGPSALQPKTMRVIFQKAALDWPTFEALPEDTEEVLPDMEVWEIQE